MKKRSSIVILGTGKVATRLGTALQDAGSNITEVYGRNKIAAEKLAKKFSANAITDLSAITRHAHVYIIAVKDDAIPLIAKKLRVKQGIVVHTSGSVEMNVLAKCSPHTGVLYPLQTFSRDRKPDLGLVPVCIEVSDTHTASVLRSIAKMISKNIVNVNSEQRAALHLSAVIANNFTNRLYALAEKKLKHHGLSFSLLHPLILETAQKAIALGPLHAQTGPAARGDLKVIRKHLRMLKSDKELSRLYKLLTANIRSGMNG